MRVGGKITSKLENSNDFTINRNIAVQGNEWRGRAKKEREIRFNQHNQ